MAVLAVIQVCPIVPTTWLTDAIADARMHLALAPVVQKNLQYQTFYQRMVDDGNYVILDNGAFEGNVVTMEELQLTAALIRAHEVVVPDVQRDASRTLDLYREYIRSPMVFQYMHMVVLQGKNVTEMLTMYRELLEIWKHNHRVGKRAILGIPKWLGARRHEVVRAVLMLPSPPKPTIHLLGYAHPNDLYFPKHLARSIRSMDTSMPAAAALKKRYTSDFPSAYSSSQIKDFFDVPSPTHVTLASYYNHLANLLRLLNYHEL